MEDLTDVYNDLIMEHSMNSYNKKKLENADYSEIGHNPNCGDEITLELKLNGDKIEDMAFSGHGCAISQASTSIMIDTLRGKTIEEAKEIIKTFIEMIKREITDEEQLKKLEDAIAFKNVSNMPARVKCALLAWHTLEDMFDINKTNVLYIHNRLPDKRNLNDKGIDFERDILALAKKQFQFGSVNNYLDEWINFANSIKLKSSQKLMSKKSLIDNLKEIYYAFSKKLSMNYDVLSKFIDENKTKITEVIVLGHSMLGVDEPYYRDVIVPKLKDVHWDVYWHKFDDASIFIEKFKLPEAKSKEW